jgi:hypothetical protein
MPPSGYGVDPDDLGTVESDHGQEHPSIYLPLMFDSVRWPSVVDKDQGRRE